MYSGMRAPFPGYFGIFCDISHMTFEIELVLSALLGQGKICAPEVCGSSCFSLCVAQALVPATLWTSAHNLPQGSPLQAVALGPYLFSCQVHAGSYYPSPCLRGCHVGFSSCERSCPGSSLLPHCCTCAYRAFSGSSAMFSYGLPLLFSFLPTSSDFQG